VSDPVDNLDTRPSIETGITPASQTIRSILQLTHSDGKSVIMDAKVPAPTGRLTIRYSLWQKDLSQGYKAPIRYLMPILRISLKLSYHNTVFRLTLMYQINVMNLQILQVLHIVSDAYPRKLIDLDCHIPTKNPLFHKLKQWVFENMAPKQAASLD